MEHFQVIDLSRNKLLLTLIPAMILFYKCGNQTGSGSFQTLPLKKKYRADVVVYGGTSAGIAAATQVARMGQSAATVAVLALDRKEPVHNVPYEVIRDQLIADGQILENPEK